MGTGDLCWVPQQRYMPEEPGNVQGRDRVGIVEESCGYRVRGVSIRGKFVLSRNPGYKTSGVAMWLNVVLTPGSLPRSQCSGNGPSASCGYCCPLCPAGGSVFGENSFYRSDKPKAVYPLSRTSKLAAWNMIMSSMPRYHTYPPHRAPVGTLSEGSSMRTCRYA